MKMEFEYCGETLYIELMGSCTKKDIKQLKQKLYYILDEYGISNIVINLSKVNSFNKEEFYFFLDDYDMNYGGNLTVLQEEEPVYV